MKRLRHRAEWCGAALLARLVPALPRRTALSLSRFLGNAWFLLDPAGRAVALANLRLVFGDELHPRELRRIAKASFQNIARTAIDMIWAQRLTAENYREWFIFEGVEEAEAIRQNSGALVIMAHFGSFDWIGIGLGYRGWRGYALTQEFKNPLLEPIYNSIRASSGQRVVNRRGALLQMLRQLGRKGLAGMLIDLTLPTNQPSRIVPVFGVLTNVTCIHAILHKRTGAPMLPVEAIPEPDGRCRITVHPPLPVSPAMSEAEIVRIAWAFLEERIRARPDLWLWNYKHWRFIDPRHLPGAPRPPFYANRSSTFDKKMRIEGLMPQPSAGETSSGAREKDIP